MGLDDKRWTMAVGKQTSPQVTLSALTDGNR